MDYLFLFLEFHLKLFNLSIFLFKSLLKVFLIFRFSLVLFHIINFLILLTSSSKIITKISTLAWIDKVRNIAYCVMSNRANFMHILHRTIWLVRSIRNLTLISFISFIEIRRLNLTLSIQVHGTVCLELFVFLFYHVAPRVLLIGVIESVFFVSRTCVLA